MTESRNAVCPCGSGKKYKRCCLERDQALKAAESPSYTQSEADQVIESLVRFAQRQEFAEFVEEALGEFFSETSGSSADEYPMEMAECKLGFFLWFVLDLPVADDGLAIIDMFSAKRSARFSAGAVRYLDALLETELRIYEVRALLGVRGGVLRDVASGEDIYVSIDMEGVGARQWDLIVTRLLRFEDGMLEVLEPAYVLPPIVLPSLLDCAKDGRKELRKILRSSGKSANRGALDTAVARLALPPLVNEVWLQVRASEREEPQPEALSLLSDDEVNTQSELRNDPAGMLDVPLSELGNRSLRALARTKSGRPRVIAFLKNMAQLDAEAHALDEPLLNTAWMWDELGISREEV